MMKRPPHAPRRTMHLAASFVVTVASLQGCTRKPVDEAMPNPPFPPPGDSAAAPPRPQPQASAHPSAVPMPSATASSHLDPMPGVKLCSATHDQRPCINKQDDGTCLFVPALAKCEKGMNCNPPRLHAVPCP